MLLLLSSALAAAPHAADASTHDRLLADFRANLAASDLAAQDDGIHPPCFTTLVNQLRESWGLFSVDERAEMTAALAPFKQDLFDDLPVTRSAPPPARGPTDSCVGQQMDNRLAGTHFVVEWDNGTTDSATAQTFLDALEYAYPVEVDDLGWNPPAGASQYLMPAYISNQNYAGAYTTVQNCGGIYAPYIVAGKGSFYGGNWYQTMALHEFNHSLQFNTAYSPEFYWWEATATFIEEEVLPSSNWWSTYIVGYSQNPWMSMSAFSQSDQDIFYHMYGMSIFGFYLREYQGGDDIVRQTWEYAAGERGQYDLSMEKMTNGIGLDWDSLYADFAARNAVMDYSEHRYYQSVDEEDKVTALPADGSAGRNTKPQGYGQNFIRFDKGAGDGSGTLVVHFHGDPDVKWLAELVEVSSSTVDRVSMGTIVDGEGDVSLETFGAEDAVLVVSPLEDDDKDYDYSWEAELVADTTPPEDTGDTNVDDTAGEDGTGDGEDIKVALPGCGCATGETGDLPGLAALGLLVGLAVTRRR